MPNLGGWHWVTALALLQCFPSKTWLNSFKDDKKAGLSLFLPCNHSPGPWQRCPLPSPSTAQTTAARHAQIGGY